MSALKSLTEQSKALEARLNALPAGIAEALRPALMRQAELVARNWRALAPDDPETGDPDYRSSITVTGPGETTPAYAEGGGKRTAGPLEALITAGNENVRYGHILEWGSSKMKARPSMLPAWRIAMPKVKPALARAITAAIKKVLKNA